MATSMGILGESTSNSIATYTIYTVPADKAARIRVMINVGGGSLTKEFSIQIAPEGSQTIWCTSVGSEHELWTGARFNATDGYPKDIGIHSANEGWAIATTTTEKDFICPLPVDYILAAGDTVKMTTLSAGIGSMLFQVMGVEDDV